MCVCVRGGVSLTCMLPERQSATTRLVYCALSHGSGVRRILTAASIRLSVSHGAETGVLSVVAHDAEPVAEEERPESRASGGWGAMCVAWWEGRARYGYDVCL